MCQIVIEIPLEALARANVAAALTELTLALRGQEAASAALPTDVRIIVETAPAANTDVEVPADPRERQFFDLLALKGELYVRYYRAVQAAGSVGLSSDQARQLIPELADFPPKVLGAIAGYAGRWAEHLTGDASPVEKTADGQRWIGWPKAV